uniref:Uncharacterized protein n=1 Tax=Knipowitschia caucasica TaxID=637954 RepID=A0AAV2L953_KNICA
MKVSEDRVSSPKDNSATTRPDPATDGQSTSPEEPNNKKETQPVKHVKSNGRLKLVRGLAVCEDPAAAPQNLQVSANQHQPISINQSASANQHQPISINQSASANLHQPICISQSASANLHQPICINQSASANQHQPIRVELSH